jgi:hypothetical protein
MKKFLKTVKYGSIWNNDIPDGWICGKWYVGYIQKDSAHSSQKDLLLFSTKAFFDQNVKELEIDEETGEPVKKALTYWSRQGNFEYLDYYSRQISLPSFKKNPTQDDLISKIMEVFSEKNKAVCLIYGRPGTGKSMTSLLLCKDLLEKFDAVGLCDTHAPNEPGDNFESFYTSAEPSTEKPVVVVLEEVDGLIKKVHTNQITQGEKTPIQIKNKTDWNCFLDKFDRGMYPGVILLMTTNQTPEYFDEMDPSYLRKNRVDIKFEF